MGFDAGALLFKIQAVGAQLFKSDMRESKTAIEGVEQASTKAKGASDELGNSSDGVAEKARKTKAPLDEQAKSTKGAGDESEKASRKQDEQAASAERQREAAQKLAAVLVGVGLAISAAVGLSVAKFAEFDAQMSNTSAATMATAAEQRELADAALDAGADTAYSATEAAAAQEELAKAGQSVADITGGSLAGSLALAAAGQLEVARSAEIMSTVLTQFRLPADQAGRASDVLAAGAGKAQGSVDDLALALTYVGPLAASMGWSLEETAGTIAYFSTQGIAGEKAGTALRGVLAALQAPSAAASKVMGEYGIQVFDASGNMIGAAGVAQQLKDKLSSLTQEERLAALGRIFGNEALSAATLLYEGGAEAVTKWTDNVSDSGYAAEQAAMRQDNLRGDIEKLGGAFDSAMIRSGSGANDVLRELVQSATFLVDVFGDAPEPIQATVLALGVAAAAALLLAGATLTVRSRWAEWRTTLELTNGQMARSALVAGAAGVALAGLGTVLAILVAKQAEMSSGAQEFSESLDKSTGSVTEYTRELIAKKLAEKGAFDGAREAGVTQKELTNALYEGGAAYEAVNRKLRDAHDASGGWNATIGNSINAFSDLNVQLADGRQRHDDLKAATDATKSADEVAADAAKEHEDALTGLSGKARDTALDISGLADAIRGFGSGALDTRDAARQFEEALDAATAAIDENGSTLDISTEAGRENEATLDAIAQAALTHAAAIVTQTGSQEGATAAIQRGRDELLIMLERLGITGAEAQAYADKLGLIPEDVPTAVSLNVDAAQQRLDQFITAITSRQATLNLRVQTMISAGASDRALAEAVGIGLPNADGNVIERYAGGGIRYEHHVAQIARAGAMRVWAEPETMGETYVPHAESKRARSEQIMAETAAIFGGIYTPRSAVQAAASAPQTAASRERPIVNQYITTQHPDPRIQMRMMSDEARRAFASA